MIISLVAAASENNVIGDTNAPNHAIPWDLPNDMQHFRDVTRGKPVIMGRKTLGFIGRALPGRVNIVVTRQKDFAFDGVEVAESLEKALEIAIKNNPEEICIIGALADRVYLTRVHATIQGDTTFPELGREWKAVWQERHEADENHAYAYTFLRFERTSK
nr:dihydrofolate reductase [uncultured bacterium]